MNNTLNKEKTQDFLQKPTDKKLRNEFLAECHKINDNEKKAQKAYLCSSYLEFISSENQTKLKTANFCKARLCPFCNWRLTQKRFSNLSKVTELAKSNKYQLLFLTLTAKNVFGDELSNEIKKYFKAWINLTRQNPQFKQSVHGWFRALEVTYNKSDNTYHPHLHIILAVKSTYFKSSDYYINQKKWTELWQHYLQIEYTPIVHIQKAYANKNGSSVEKEVSKYTIKDTDYLIPNDLERSARVVQVLDSALKGVRIIAFGGILKKYYQELKLNEESYTEELDDITDDIFYITKKYRWNFGAKFYQEFLE